MSNSNYLENALLNWFKGTAFPAPPATTYVALYTAAPSDAGGGTEVTGGAYARVGIAAAGWSAISDNAGSGRISNSGTVTYAQATANWGTVTHFGVFDTLTAGNLLRWAALGSPVAINSGTTASFAAGTLTLDQG